MDPGITSDSDLHTKPRSAWLCYIIKWLRTKLGEIEAFNST